MLRRLLVATALLLVAGCSGKADSTASVTLSSRSEAPASEHPPAAMSEAHPPPPRPLDTSWYEVDIRTTDRGIRDVFVNDKNVTRFERPQHIYTAQVSPTNRYLLVWHLDYTPRKASIYDLKRSVKVSTFVPGAGGDLQWTAGDLIYHEFGAGTNTAIFYVYGTDGNVLWHGNFSGAELCESGRYVFIYPTLPLAKEEIMVADVRNGNVLGSARPDGIANVIAHTWLDGLNIRFWYDDVEGRTETVDIRLRPDDPVPWDVAYHGGQ